MQNNSWIGSLGKVFFYLLVFACFDGLLFSQTKNNLALGSVLSSGESSSNFISQQIPDRRLEYQEQLLRERQQQFKQDYQQQRNHQQQQWQNQRLNQQRENRDYRRYNQERLFHRQNNIRRQQRYNQQKPLIKSPRQL